MTITLGSLTLSDHLQLRGVEAASTVTLEVSRTILGRTIINTAAAPAGHALELTADMDGDTLRGWFTRAEVEAIVALRDAATTVALVHPRGSYQVIVTGLDVEPVFDVNNPTAAWDFSGSVKLLTV